MKKTLTLVAVVVLMVVLASVVLTACIPSNYEKAKEKLEKAEYGVASSSAASVLSYLGLSKEGATENEVYALKVNSLTSYDYCAIFYYANSKDAKAAYDSYKEALGEDTKLVLKKSGKAVFIGTEAAYKAL